MTFAQIKQIASGHGIRVVGVKKTDIVRAIQRQEGNDACFSSGKASKCGQQNCLWLTICE